MGARATDSPTYGSGSNVVSVWLDARIDNGIECLRGENILTGDAAPGALPCSVITRVNQAGACA